MQQYEIDGAPKIKETVTKSYFVNSAPKLEEDEDSQDELEEAKAHQTSNANVWKQFLLEYKTKELKSSLIDQKMSELNLNLKK